jgi:hypothetical protein
MMQYTLCLMNVLLLAMAVAMLSVDNNTAIIARGFAALSCVLTP